LVADGIVGPVTLGEMKKAEDTQWSAISSPVKPPAPVKPKPVRISRPKPTLKNGDRGTEVRQLQHILRSWVVVGVDGAYGPQTAGAVKQFQKFWSLYQDGIYGPQTAAMLDKVLILEGR
jgi:peptidoglycan hydrolase-like protein with peptidoglycan-binding domain